MTASMTASTDVAIALQDLKNTSDQHSNQLIEQKVILGQLAAVAIKQAEMSQQMIALSKDSSAYQERTDKKIDALNKDVKTNTRTNYMWIGAGAALSTSAIILAITTNLSKLLGS